MVIVIAQFPAKPEEGNKLFEAFQQALPDTRRFDGCLGMEFARELDKPHNFLLIERWESKEKYDKYLNWRIETGLLEALGPLMTGQPVISYWIPGGA
ncbi:MAG: antibiotic biosynthesis monooxygenase [Myxococcales bacterium]|nr:antibiotic biosynthesis monooxygenase [Myxococcales bacterium]